MNVWQHNVRGSKRLVGCNPECSQDCRGLKLWTLQPPKSRLKPPVRKARLLDAAGLRGCRSDGREAPEHSPLHSVFLTLALYHHHPPSEDEFFKSSQSGDRGLPAPSKRSLAWGLALSIQTMT